MSEAIDQSDTECQLLMAAAIHGVGPNVDIDRANTVRVVDQVLRWQGLSADEVKSGWLEIEERSIECSDDCSGDSPHEQVYDVLARMTQQLCPGREPRPAERPGIALMEGSGNWGVPGDPESPPCMPQFNSCRLTQAGARIAQELLTQHPELKKM